MFFPEWLKDRLVKAQLQPVYKPRYWCSHCRLFYYANYGNCPTCNARLSAEK